MLMVAKVRHLRGMDAGKVVSCRKGGHIMGRFTLPRDVYFGKGALEILKTLKGKKAIVCVGGGSMKRGGQLAGRT